MTLALSCVQTSAFDADEDEHFAILSLNGETDFRLLVHKESGFFNVTELTGSQSYENYAGQRRCRDLDDRLEKLFPGYPLSYDSSELQILKLLARYLADQDGLINVSRLGIGYENLELERRAENLSKLLAQYLRDENEPTVNPTVSTDGTYVHPVLAILSSLVTSSEVNLLLAAMIGRTNIASAALPTSASAGAQGSVHWADNAPESSIDDLLRQTGRLSIGGATKSPKARRPRECVLAMRQDRRPGTYYTMHAYRGILGDGRAMLAAVREQMPRLDEFLFWYATDNARGDYEDAKTAAVEIATDNLRVSTTRNAAEIVVVAQGDAQPADDVDELYPLHAGEVAELRPLIETAVEDALIANGGLQLNLDFLRALQGDTADRYATMTEYVNNAATELERQIYSGLRGARRRL